jgi:hypothetical protein
LQESKAPLLSKQRRRFIICKFMTARLNDDCQGEGGTLAIINTDNTPTHQKMQGLLLRKKLALV